jgi:hypothetical protein
MSRTADELIEYWDVDRAHQVRFGDSYAHGEYHALGWVIRHAWEAGYVAGAKDTAASMDEES